MAFGKRIITVPASPSVTIIFDNRDNGIPHNFALYQDETAVKRFFAGEIITGPKVTGYQFGVPDMPRSYFFRCDVHLKTMTGTFEITGR